MVKLVSAMEVARTILRRPCGSGMRAACCSAWLSCPYSGCMAKLLDVRLRISAVLRISAWPGRNTRVSPSCSLVARAMVLAQWSGNCSRGCSPV